MCTVAVLALVLPSPATATGVDGLATVDDGGEAVMVCAGPNFINCSIAVATAVGGCIAIKGVKDPCLEAFAGAVGGISSIAVLDFGGGATGDVNQAPLNCSWDGASGACLAASGGLVGNCITVTTNAEGFLALPVAALEGAKLAGIPAPPAKAVAPDPCDLSDITEFIQDEETSAEADIEPDVAASACHELSQSIAESLVKSIDKQVKTLIVTISVEGLADIKEQTAADGYASCMEQVL